MERLKIVSVESKTEVGRLHAICRGSFKRYYPGFDGWYRAKVLPGIGSSRWVLKAISGDRMAGICIVKDDGAEDLLAARGRQPPRTGSRDCADRGLHRAP